MVGNGDILGYLVELGGNVGRKRVVLTVDGSCLQRGIQLAEGQRSRVGSQSLAQMQPRGGVRHAQQQSLHVGILVDRAVAGVDDTGSEIEGAKRNDIHLLLDAGEDILLADVAIEDTGHVLIAGPEISAIDHCAPLQSLLGGERRERKICQVGLAIDDGVKLVLRREERAVGIGLADNRSTGQLLHLVGKCGHGGGMRIASDRHGGKNQFNRLLRGTGTLFRTALRERHRNGKRERKHGNSGFLHDKLLFD